MPEKQESLDEAHVIYLKNQEDYYSLIKTCNDKNISRLHLHVEGQVKFTKDFCELKSLQALTLDWKNLDSIPLEICRLESLTGFQIFSYELQEIPEQLWDLPLLKQLFIHCNKLKTLSKSIKNLKTLYDLSITSINLIELPKEIGELKALQSLDVQAQKIKVIPAEIGDLHSLTSLQLFGTQIDQLPTSIGHLKKLESIYIEYARIKKLPKEIGLLSSLEILTILNCDLQSLPSEIGQIRSLFELDLRNNALTSLPYELNSLKGLQHIYLHGNELLKIPPSILGSDPSLTPSKYGPSPKSILDYYFGANRKENSPLNEVKIILVGRGGAGKTSIANALLGKDFNESEESTPGISLCDWKMKDFKKKPDVTAHLWDFAGQVIAHSLHQFFFSMRSVYILVLTGRENNEREDAEYWLRLIKAFGTDDKGNGPPVIVALNKWEKSGCRPSVDKEALKERYPFIHNFLETDCKSQRGISNLKKAIHKSVDNSEWVRASFPNTWDKVRQSFASPQDKKKKPHLTYEEFRARCDEIGIREHTEQDSLAEILHNLGIALNYRRDPRLREATVLQPEWLTKNVYALLRKAEHNTGTLTIEDANKVLKAEKNPHMRDYLLQIMERFEISYAIEPEKNERTNIWLVPQALPDLQPRRASEIAASKYATRFRYKYAALPEGLVARAIVRLHDFIKIIDSKKLQWASGAILVRDEAEALIRSYPEERQVEIIVIGEEKARQQLAGLCQTEMRDIHSEISGLNPEELTFVYETWVPTQTFEKDEEEHRQQTGIATTNGTKEIAPSTINNLYSTSSARDSKIRKPKVFISYSKHNAKQRARLETELKVLRNQGLIENHWQDRMIDAGDDWDEAIQKNLHDAQIFIFLASSYSLATDYITQNELPIAITLANAKKQTLIPVILEECRWYQTLDLGEKNALPTKAKAINLWSPQSRAWHDIANGISKICEQWITQLYK